ncbi:peptidoglycan-binding protein [uncultured Roseibium sp.]|uniref:peptidoglycan-binding protein n=1 Tax=uncultured Roseibium sp. TaxID=1936171 RepID=UPI00261B87F2|nr:peptidoglycan-binding protein [uncultured Roseibium sp.]
MPAWKKHEAGRRGRDAYESDDFYETAGREPARDRIERLTRTATALGGGHDPRMRDSRDDDLNAVADELDRMLSERGGNSPARPKRTSRPQRSAPQRHAPPPSGGIEDVLGALDRLDEQVQGLAGTSSYDDVDRHGPQRSYPQPGRYAMDALEERSHYDAPHASYGDAREADGYEDDYGHDPRSGRGPVQHAHNEASLHIYKDLGRRIDALRAPQEKAFIQVREELGSLREALGGISRGTSETVGRQNAELRRLADMVERLRADKRGEQFAAEIRKEVADLKSMVGRTNVEGALQTLEHGYSHILQRLDELSRASLDPRVLHGVTVRLNEIEEAFSALPRSEHLMVLEDRVAHIAERMEELLQREGQMEIEPLRAELREVRGYVEQIDIKGLIEGIDDRMTFVSGRLDDLEVLAREQRGLDSRLSAMEERMPQPETIARLQGRLEDIAGMMADDRLASGDNEHLSQVDGRLDEIVDRLERIEQAAPLPAADAGAFKALEQRLEGISGKIDVIEKKASRPAPVFDAAAVRAATGPDAKILAQVQERLSHLSARLDEPKDTVTTSDLDKLREEIGSMRDSVSAPSSTENLEARISDLAQLVSKGAEATDDDRFEQLGEKVAALAAQIESSASVLPQGLGDVGPVLERIERGLEQTRTDVTDIARKAAFDAVANAPTPRSEQYDEAISALQGDLKRLLDAAEGGEQRTRNTFESVKSVLGSLTERLDKLERSDVREQPVSAAKSAPAGRAQTFVEEPVSSLSQSAQMTRDAMNKAAAAADPKPDNPEDRSRARKADFIAAARRAAQAASVEAEKLEQSQESDLDESNTGRGKARAGWFRNVLKRGNAPKSGDDIPAPSDDLELGADDLVEDMPDGPQAPVLPGDRPAPETVQRGGNRRRAIMLAAVAVVLTLGTLTAYKFVAGSGDSAPVASAEPEQSTIAGTSPAPVGGNAAPATTANAASGAAPRNGAVEDQVAPQVSASPDTGTEPRTVAQTPTIAENTVAPEQPALAEQAAAIANVRATQATSTGSPEPEVAFAPPAGVADNFGQSAVDDGATPTAPGSLTTSESGAGGLIANLPPEGVGPMALRSAAAGGNPAAEFLVGVRYTEGKGVQADLAKAAVWYQKAANKGLPPAQYRLASLYEKGRGVDKDVAKARAWYSQAAQAGNAKAMHNLAVLYAEGGGQEPDYAKAAMWFEAAANYGVKDSLFNLGILYAGGIGVDKDLVASYKWFAIAADKGDPEAAKRRDDVANMMDQQTLANARLAVEGFSLQEPDPTANKVTLEPSWADEASLPAANVSVDAPAGNTDMIREAQDKLNYLGFDTGTPDGQMGPRTRSAIKAFQRSIGLPETGEVDGKLIDELKSQAI